MFFSNKKAAEAAFCWASLARQIKANQHSKQAH